MPLNLVHGVAVVESDDGVRPITTARTGVIGIAGSSEETDGAVWPYGTPKLVRSLNEALTLLNAAGEAVPASTFLSTGVRGIYAQNPGALVVMVRTDPAGPQVGDPDEFWGQQAADGFLMAESVVGVKPRILVHLETNTTLSEINALLGPLTAVAKRLRAVMVLDGPGGSFAAMQTFANGLTGDRDRMYLVSPGVQGPGGAGKASPYVAGLISRMDNERGFWWSPSNQRINGITGTTVPVDFALGDSSSLADLLNGEHIATIVRKDGFRLWGNRTLEKTDPKWRFLSVRRIADILNDTLLENHLWAVDRNITRTYLENVADGVNAYIRQLVALGAILGGRCIPSPELNTPESISLGHVHFDFEFTPATPAEKITFRSALVNDYIEEIL